MVGRMNQTVETIVEVLLSHCQEIVNGATTASAGDGTPGGGVAVGGDSIQLAGFSSRKSGILNNGDQSHVDSPIRR